MSLTNWTERTNEVKQRRATVSREVKDPSENTRCRLYLDRGNFVCGPGIELYSEVWDSPDRPYPESDLPEGEPIVFEGASEEEVCKKVDAFCASHSYKIMIGDWDGRGSI
jgi:hypothetical protein